MNRPTSRRALVFAGATFAVCVSAFSTAVRPVHAAVTTTTYYFHGTSQDTANRAAGSPTATFDTTKPTGSSDATQTGDDPVANEAVAANEFIPYWESTDVSGTFNGRFHFDWWWMNPNPEITAGQQDAVDIAVFADGNLISVDSSGKPAVVTANLNPGLNSPTENTADVPVNGSVVHSLVIQVRGHNADTSNGDTMHYDSTSAPSFFTAPTPTPLPLPTPTSAPCTDLCFAPPVTLPKSDITGGTNLTCYNPCGEPSLAVSPVDGTLYVSTPRTILVCCNTQASPVWQSSDDGNTWSKPIFPSAPGGQNPLTGGDTELAVDKRGTVYEGELWLGSDSIYQSPDKGQTWTWSPASHDVGADREWFAYSPTEDALYGWYDGFKGLMVVKAPLTTPLGTNSAEFFPQERVAVPECDVPLAADCGSALPANSAAGTPVLNGAIAPGRPSVSPVDGTVYFPFPYQVAGQGIGIASTNDGLSFNYSFVKGAGHGNLGDAGNDFPVTAVDKAGNLYVAWVENKGDGFNLYFAASTDKGATWTTPTEVSKGISATALFPNIVAGAAGQVAVSWYGTSVNGDPNGTGNAGDPMATAPWTVYTAETLGATGTQPVFSTGIVQQNFHTGVICTHGAACTGTTRKLLDFFDMKIDSHGALLVVYARDGVGGSGTQIAFARQAGGCNLNQPSCTPTANTPESPTVAALAGAGLAVTGLAVIFRRRRKAGGPTVV